MTTQNISNVSRCSVTCEVAKDSVPVAPFSGDAVGAHKFERRDFGAVFDLITDILAVAWSLGMMQMKTEIANELRSRVVALGHRLDDLVGSTKDGKVEEDTKKVQSVLPGQPYALVNLPGMMVIFKPQDWEVNRTDPTRHGAVEWSLLSDWVSAAFPPSMYPITHSSEYDFGFIHRLDVPSSGLVMSAKNFVGHSLLRWQLDTYELDREYIILCKGSVDPDCRDVRERLRTGHAKTFVHPQGAPARTRLSSLAFLWPSVDPDVACALTSIKIHTGRHHQIRAHLTYLEHPCVADGRYSARRVMLRDACLCSDALWFQRQFGRPAVPLYQQGSRESYEFQTEKFNGLMT